MKPVLYSIEDSINSFFTAHPTVTQKQCDTYAVMLAGEPVKPVDIQGSFSYTVIAGTQQSKIIQFRDADSGLDTNILALARRIHGHYVADSTFHGKVGQSPPLLVYSMEKLPGIPYVLAQSRYHIPAGSLVGGSHHYNTVVDYAIFFAASWKGRQYPEDTQAIISDYQSRFELLSQVLPPRFRSNLDKVQAGLPSLFASTYPMALNHGDLSEMNILVDPRTGHITGVIDWAEAKVCPFGISLWGLENVLGSMDHQGWHYHPHCCALRNLFWSTLEQTIGQLSGNDKRTIQIARMAGLFLQYGFTWEDDGLKPVEKDSVSFRYLDTFCATDT